MLPDGVKAYKKHLLKVINVKTNFTPGPSDVLTLCGVKEETLMHAQYRAHGYAHCSGQ